MRGGAYMLVAILVSGFLLVANSSARAVEPRPAAVAGRAIQPAMKTPPARKSEPTASKQDSRNEFARAPKMLIGAVPEDLLAKRLTIPVPGVKARELRPHFFDARGQRGHEAIDIIAPRGVPVVAVEGGKIAKLFLSVPGGITVYQFDPTQTYAYYYAHLDHYADGLAEGDTVERGQILGYVGSTGNADPMTPHLHFAIFRLGSEKRWWQGEALDPYPALMQ